MDALPAPSGSADARELRVLAGGKGANPALAAAQLGAHVALVGAVGDDEAGASTLRELAALGLDVTAVERVAHVPTGHIVHLVEPGGVRRYVEAVGANGHVRAEAVPPADVTLVSTALPRAAVERAVRAAAGRGETRGGETGGSRPGLVVLDVAGEAETARAVLPHVDVVRGDADEIVALLAQPVEDFDSAVAAARRLLDAGPSLAVVQAGSDGDVFVRADAELRLPRVDVPVVDPTGAGDVLVATLAVLLAQGRPLAEAAERASRAAAETTARLGGRPAL